MEETVLARERERAESGCVRIGRDVEWNSVGRGGM